MTVCGTGMGGPAVAIGVEELAHMGGNTFIRVGSCGVFQEGQKPGDVIAASGTVRAGGTSLAYLPPTFPAVPTFSVLRALVEAGEELKIPVTVGVGIAGDAFYAPRDTQQSQQMKSAGLVFVEMESDTLFIVGAVRGWRTGAVFTSDGGPGQTKPEWGEADFRRGENDAIKSRRSCHVEDCPGGSGEVKVHHRLWCWLFYRDGSMFSGVSIEKAGWWPQRSTSSR